MHFQDKVPPHTGPINIWPLFSVASLQVAFFWALFSTKSQLPRSLLPLYPLPCSISTSQLPSSPVSVFIRDPPVSWLTCRGEALYARVPPAQHCHQRDRVAGWPSLCLDGRTDLGKTGWVGIPRMNGQGEDSVQFSRSVVSYSLQPHESQHIRPPCPSPTPGFHSDSHSLSQ